MLTGRGGAAYVALRGKRLLRTVAVVFAVHVVSAGQVVAARCAVLAVLFAAPEEC